MDTTSTSVNVDVAPAQDIGYAILEIGEANQEMVKWGAKSSLTLSSMLRGLSLTALTDTEVAGNKKTHQINDSIEETNVHYLINDKVSNAGYETIEGLKLFSYPPKSLTAAGAIVPTASTAGTPSAGGAVTDGTHSYRVTYVDSIGGETIQGLASNIITTSGGSNTVALTAIPTGDDDVVSRKIYRTVAGDTGNYKLLATIADNTTTAYSDIIADGSLGADAPIVPISYEFIRYYEYNAEVVKLTGDQTIAGVKTFSSIPIGPSADPTTDDQLARKKYIDDLIAAFSIPNIVDEHIIYTPAYLTGGTNAETTVALWDNLADASLRITLDGTAYNIDGMDMTATGPLGIVTDMDDVASVIQHYIRIGTSGTETCVWSTDHFIFTSADTTVTSAILVLETSTGTVGTDISGAGASDWTDCDTGNGVASVAVIDKTADVGKLVKLDASGEFNDGFIKKDRVIYGETISAGEALSTIKVDNVGANILVDDDTYLDSGNPTVNYGSATGLNLENSPSQATLMKFASFPADLEKIVSFTLNYYVETKTATSKIKLYTSPGNMDFSTITYNGWITSGRVAISDDSASITSTGWKTVTCDYEAIQGATQDIIDYGIQVQSGLAGSDIVITSIDNVSGNGAYISDLVYMSYDGKVHLADASISDSVSQYVGIAKEGGVVDDVKFIATSDFAPATGLTPGVAYYLTDVAGVIDSTAGTYIKQVGKGYSATSLLITSSDGNVHSASTSASCPTTASTDFNDDKYVACGFRPRVLMITTGLNGIIGSGVYTKGEYTYNCDDGTLHGITHQRDSATAYLTGPLVTTSITGVGNASAGNASCVPTIHSVDDGGYTIRFTFATGSGYASGGVSSTLYVTAIK